MQSAWDSRSGTTVSVISRKEISYSILEKYSLIIFFKIFK
jgi:hypothetical protein